MANQNPDIDNKLVNHLKQKYFNDASKLLSLSKGEILIHQNDINKRLYLILDGYLTGYLVTNTGHKHEVFQSGKDMFVGVHSFFSANHIIYANVVASENCRVAYIDKSDIEKNNEVSYRDDFLPLIVQELSARQRFSKDMMLEKEVALKKLYHNEKMSTLGQMAAGLAHELNNAIGVLSGNSEWIVKAFENYLNINVSANLIEDFNTGFNSGYAMSSQQVRENKRKIEKAYKLPSHIAKRLAKLNYSSEQLSALSKSGDIDEISNQKVQIWELGVALRDMIISSKHATHVLKSIKQLSSSEQVKAEININDTIKEALTILKKVIATVDIQLKLSDTTTIMANSGEFIQIWVNIIKNACESMVNAKTNNPKLVIKSIEKKGIVTVQITDNGPGMPEEVRKKIFQPNFTTKKDGLEFGLGLGLSIVQRLVDNYHGKIEVKSKPGNTTFFVQIPTNIIN